MAEKTRTDAPASGFDVAGGFERNKEKKEKQKKAKEKKEKADKERAEEEKNETLSRRPGSSGYPIDILEEESRGAHILKRHVGKNEDYLRRRIETEDIDAAGSFTSVEAANKVINAAIKANKDKVRQVVTGQMSRAVLEWKPESITGYEMYKPSPNSQARRGDTYWVRVVIERDVSNPRGFRLVTALPFNKR